LRIPLIALGDVCTRGACPDARRGFTFSGYRGEKTGATVGSGVSDDVGIRTFEIISDL
jgi:hypothetical protein